MSSGSNVSWLSVLEDKQTELRSLSEQGYPIPKGPLDRRALRRGFEQLCRKQSIRDRIQLEYQYIDASCRILNLAKAIARSAPSLQNPPWNEGLESLICTIALATLEVSLLCWSLKCLTKSQLGYKHGASVSLLALALVELNNTVPQLGPEVCRFPHDSQVQQPLQEVYITFFDSHVAILKILRDGKFQPNSHLRFAYDFREDETIKTLNTSTKAQIEGARARFDTLTSQALSREERERTIRTLPSHGEESASNLREQHDTFSVTYAVLRELGRGSYGVVQEVEERSTRSRYARKRILFDRVGTAEEVEKKVENEVWIMRNLRHQNIVTLGAFFKELDGFSIMIHPVADYHLRQFFDICLQKQYHESYTRHINPWFGSLLDALAFTHKNEIRHRDVKPSNILIKNNAVYLCDFGLAKDFTGEDSSASRGPKPEGTPEYRAPEIISDQRRGRLADVFSLGCVFSEMLTVSHGESADEFRETRQGKPFRDCLPGVRDWVMQFRNRGHSPLLCTIINRMLSESPKERIEAQKALDDLRTDRALYGLD
ncbi:MAG: hypothetical protein Q9201_004519 [Fulgogasparrea decipioides]